MISSLKINVAQNTSNTLNKLPKTSKHDALLFMLRSELHSDEMYEFKICEILTNTLFNKSLVTTDEKHLAVLILITGQHSKELKICQSVYAIFRKEHKMTNLGAILF